MWPQKEHEKFLAAMMKHLTQAFGSSALYRRKAEEIFPEVSEVMVNGGYQRDSDECYIYWHYFIRQTVPFKYSPLEFPPPPAEMKSDLQKKIKAEQWETINKANEALLATEKIEAGRLAKRRKADQALLATERATPKPYSYVDPREVRKAAARIIFNPYIPVAGGGSMVMMVPSEIAGIIIGKQGKTVYEIERRIGCFINVSVLKDAVDGFRPVTISGTLQATSEARDSILDLFGLAKFVASIEPRSTSSGFEVVASSALKSLSRDSEPPTKDADYAAPVEPRSSSSKTSGPEIVASSVTRKSLSKTTSTNSSARQTISVFSDTDDCEIVKITSVSREARRPDDEALPPSQTTHHTPQARVENSASSRPLDANSWNARSVNILHVAVDTRRKIEFHEAMYHRNHRSLHDDQFWIYIARRLTEAGFQKDAKSCRKQWEKTFKSVHGLDVVRLDGPSEDVGIWVKGHSIIRDLVEPQNGEWSVQEMWEVDDLVATHKNVSFAKEAPQKEILNGGLTWESITKLHNLNGWDRSISSLAKMWTDVRNRKAPLPFRPNHLIPKRRLLVRGEDGNGKSSSNWSKRVHTGLLPSAGGAGQSSGGEDGNEEGSSNWSKRARTDLLGAGGTGQSSSGKDLREHFDDKIRKLQQSIDGIEQRLKVSDQKVAESDTELAQLEFQKQAIQISRKKDVSERAEFHAEHDELTRNLEAMQATKNAFFG